ncbi:hypothetical protein MPER_08436 [Moniliophthora perniciosa FA553]|nr:hypothetical protein MPER_08436 [Moniliophthora perniciosa FA553]
MKKLATASEQIAEAAKKYRDREPKVEVDMPEKYSGEPEKAEDFINALILYFMGKHINSDANEIILALSLIKGGTNSIAENWANLQRKMLVEGNDDRLKTWDEFYESFITYFKYSSTQGGQQSKLGETETRKDDARWI